MILEYLCRYENSKKGLKNLLLNYLLRSSQTLCLLGDLLFFLVANLLSVGGSSLACGLEVARNLGFLAATLPLLWEKTSRPPAISMILIHFVQRI